MDDSIITGKKTLKLSTTSTLRYREPTNQYAVGRMTQHIHDYKTFQKFIPDRFKNVLVEATQGNAKGRTMATNKSGTSSIMGPIGRVELGGSPDEPGPF